jgi:hypothetical protein
MPHPLLLYVIPAFSYGCKIGAGVKAGYRAYDLLATPNDHPTMSESGKTTIAALNGMTAIAQTADIIADLIAPPPVQLGMKAVVALCDTGRVLGETAAKDEITTVDAMTCLSTLAFRTTGVARPYFALSGMPVEEAKNTIEALEISSAVIGLTTECIKLHQRRQRAPALEPSPIRPPMTAIDQKVDPYEKAILEIKQANSIDDFSSIPILWETDKALNQYRCPIQNRPIRFLCRLKGEIPVFYEKKTLAEWFSQHPDESPSGWPEALPYLPNSVIKNPAEQKTIDAALSALLIETKAEFE